MSKDTKLSVEFIGSLTGKDKFIKYRSQRMGNMPRSRTRQQREAPPRFRIERQIFNRMEFEFGRQRRNLKLR